MGDVWDVTGEMADAADQIDMLGIAMEEYDEFGFPEEFRSRVELAMRHWDEANYHAHEAVKAMKKIAEEHEGPQFPPPGGTSTTLEPIPNGDSE